MTLPIGQNDLAGLHEFTVTFKDHRAPLPQKKWADWFTENNMPDYEIDGFGKRIIMHSRKPTDCEVVLPEVDIDTGWTLEWET